MILRLHLASVNGTSRFNLFYDIPMEFSCAQAKNHAADSDRNIR
jgi:hypothetical protein